MKQLPLNNPHFVYLERSFKEWLDILGYSHSTVHTLPVHLREFLYFLEQEGITQLKDLQVEHFHSHVENLKIRSNEKRGGALSNNYLNKHIQALKLFSDHLRRSGKLELPCLNIPAQECDTRDIHYLDQEEIKELYMLTDEHDNGRDQEALAARDRAMLTVFYACGLRRNEGVHLDLSDINFDRTLLHVRKGKNYKERFVPFNRASSDHLQKWIYDHRPTLLKQQPTNALLISQRGSRISGQALALRLKQLQQRSNDITLKEKDLHLHTLRHSIATHLLDNGMELAAIARFLGHSSLESTQIYTHLLEKEDQPVILSNAEGYTHLLKENE